MSNWWKSITSEFDGTTPELTHLNVRFDEQTVVALLFETERRPFVVRNPLHGKPGGGPISLEVPWREVSSTRTARRIDLLKMLAPLSKKPSFEALDGRLVIAEKAGPSSYKASGGLWLDIYVVPADSNQLVIPLHKCEVRLQFGGVDKYYVLNGLHFKGSKVTADVSHTITYTRSELTVDGPGRFAVSAQQPHFENTAEELRCKQLTLYVRLCKAGESEPFSIPVAFTQTRAGSGVLAVWQLNAS